MEMESSRRPPFDRSREQLNSVKKPRLGAEDPRSRPQQQLPNASGLGRYRSVSNTSSGSEGSGSSVVQQNQELVNQYRAALSELTFNSKPIITNLTIIAGENLQSARAITATICSNILEVPSEQKLPSLYLLDSIVKNIGRDYIKYFAARLPEVFCKAYRDVDPATHPNMRHLFGTWKGFFPPQQLQIIEKELGFSTTGIGPLSGSTTSKTDSHSQRPSSSIHVNPKYLEARHRLQQPKRADIDESGLEPPEVVGRPDRTVGTGMGRLWADPSVKNIQTPQRETSIQKQESLGYRDFASSGLKRPFSSSVGKPAGQGYEERWLGPNEEVEAKPMQRNGFDVKRGISNYAGTRSGSSSAPLMKNPPRNNVDPSKSWKNSEEEEYMWEDLGTGATDPGSGENLQFSGQPSKWQSQTEVRSNFEREPSTDPLSSEQKEHVLFSQSRSSTLLHQVANRSVSGGASSVGISSLGAPGTSILGSTAADGQRYPSPGQSQTHQRSPSPSISKRDPRQSLVRKNLKSQALVRSDPRAASISGQANMIVRDPNSQRIPSRQQNSPSANVASQKLSSLQQTPNVPSSEMLSDPETRLSTFVQKAQDALGLSSLKGDVPSDSVDCGDLRGQSSVSDLLAAVMKNGLFSGSDVGQLGVQPTTNSLSSKGAASPALPDLVTPSVSQIKGEIEKLLRPSGPTSSSELGQAFKGATSNPLSILSTLVSRGLISAPKTEVIAPATVQCETQLLEQNPKVAVGASVLVPPVPECSATSTMETISSLDSLGKGLDILAHSAKSVDDLIGLDFKPPVMRQFHPIVIDKLSENLPHSCAACGLCFKLPDGLAKHLEWHAFKNSLPNCLNRPSRRWYSNTSDWVNGNVGFPFGYNSNCISDGSSWSTEEKEETVPADESQCVCLLCGELFDEFYSQQRDEWMFKGAVYMPILSGITGIGPSSESDAQNMIVHANCMSEEAVRDLGLFSGVKGEKTA